MGNSGANPRRNGGHGNIDAAYAPLFKAIMEVDEDDIPCAKMGNFNWEALPDHQAKRLCGGCPIRQPCANYAAHSHSHATGIWGGQRHGSKAWQADRPLPRERPERRPPTDRPNP